NSSSDVKEPDRLKSVLPKSESSPSDRKNDLFLAQSSRLRVIISGGIEELPGGGIMREDQAWGWGRSWPHGDARPGLALLGLLAVGLALAGCGGSDRDAASEPTYDAYAASAHS